MPRSDSGHVLGTMMPIARSIIHRDGSLLPAYREWETTGLVSNGSLVVTREDGLAEPMFSFKKMTDELPYRHADVTSDREKRTLVLFENNELLVAHENGHAFVRKVDRYGGANFRSDRFTGSQFWDMVNPHLDLPFVPAKRARYSTLRFPRLDPKGERMGELTDCFWRLLRSIHCVALPHGDTALFNLTCASRRTEATVSVLWDKPILSSTDLGGREAAAELVSRVVTHFAPLSEALRVPGNPTRSWVPKQDATWVGQPFPTGRGNASAMTAVEVALARGRLRAELGEIGVACDDLFDNASEA